MRVYTVQLNHPGIEKPYRLGNEYINGSGYCIVGNQIIREWNSEQHYRKFIGTVPQSVSFFTKKIRTSNLN